MTNELYHYGVLGMKWGVRRYQNRDGTLTSAGKKRYRDAYVDPSKFPNGKDKEIQEEALQYLKSKPEYKEMMSDPRYAISDEVQKARDDAKNMYLNRTWSQYNEPAVHLIREWYPDESKGLSDEEIIDKCFDHEYFLAIDEVFAKSRGPYSRSDVWVSRSVGLSGKTSYQFC